MDFSLKVDIKDFTIIHSEITFNALQYLINTDTLILLLLFITVLFSYTV